MRYDAGHQRLLCGLSTYQVRRLSLSRLWPSSSTLLRQPRPSVNHGLPNELNTFYHRVCGEWAMIFSRGILLRSKHICNYVRHVFEPRPQYEAAICSRYGIISSHSISRPTTTPNFNPRSGRAEYRGIVIMSVNEVSSGSVTVPHCV